jgi:hypothetical protein
LPIPSRNESSPLTFNRIAITDHALASLHLGSEISDLRLRIIDATFLQSIQEFCIGRASLIVVGVVERQQGALEPIRNRIGS